MTLSTVEPKKHVSFSELRTWLECPYQHKLTYLDKIELEDNESHYLDYGTIMHATIEEWLNGGSLDADACEKKLREAWAEKGFDSPEYIQRLTEAAESARWKYKHSDLEAHVSWARNALSELPEWMDEQFGDWECISVEDLLYEPTEHVLNEETFNFKGFIDAVILSRKADKRGKIKEKYWIIDWKTARAGGWSIQKQQDMKTWGQLAFYKKFWSLREQKPMKSIGCAFVLLKKTPKQGRALGRLDVSVGPKAVERVEKSLSSFVAARKSGMALKKKFSCRFCDYLGTEHCDSKGF
jgi:hypothetical protein